MSVNPYFNDFLSNIRLTNAQRDDLIKGHSTLRSRLYNDNDLSKIIVDTFLQGSYRRATAIKPKNGKRADVDVIVVTNLNRHLVTPCEAINKFILFVEKHYKGKYRIQGRSIGIDLSYVDLDIVVTSAPSEANQNLLKSESVRSSLDLEKLNNDWLLSENWREPGNRSHVECNWLTRMAAEWKTEPLHIPDQEANRWVQTDPLEQIQWTRDKNKATKSNYVNVVKALKWWRICQLTDLKYPKGYPIEHMIGDCCPDGISTVAEGVVKTLESIVSVYASNRERKATPTLPDRGVPSHNVWKRVSNEDFVTFYDHVKAAAELARKAYDAPLISESLKYWRELFGTEFPVMTGEDARQERLEAKAQGLESGRFTIGNRVNIITGTTGMTVPRERNYYDSSNIQRRPFAG